VDAESRRRVNIYTTEKGRRLIGDLGDGIVENYRVLLNRLSEKDQERLVEALESLVEILGKLEQSPSDRIIPKKDQEAL
jgi:DNA-binding MarR family transcriptional regulator